MRNIIGTVLMYAQIIYGLPIWFTSGLMAIGAYWASTHWAASNIIWTPGTTSWVGITGLFGLAAAAKPAIRYFDRLDKESFEAHEAYELAG